MGDQSSLTHHILTAHADSSIALDLHRELADASELARKSAELKRSRELAKQMAAFRIRSQKNVKSIAVPNFIKTTVSTMPSPGPRVEYKRLAKQNQNRSAPKIYIADIKGERRLSEMKLPPSASPGLGELVKSEGHRLTLEGNEIFVAAKCSCQGENETCFKCGGTGFYEKKMINAVTNITPEGSISRPEVTFSNDYRGGIYGIRENGRFESSPLEDDYDE